ncbi:MAG: hypothetical protein V3S98_08065 [Dehalococcoidia bacterium]
MTTQAIQRVTRRKSVKAAGARTVRFCTSAVQISGFLGALVSVLLDRLIF